MNDLHHKAQWTTMKTTRGVIPSGGFTMIEIAISLAVIAFALVAIIGVLPTGLQVQRENREETIINQDAQLWMDAISYGTFGLDYLTNYVDQIERFGPPSAGRFYPNVHFRSAAQMIGLMTYPVAYRSNGRLNVDYSRYSASVVRAINCPLTEQPLTQSNSQGLQATNVAFRYLLICKILPTCSAISFSDPADLEEAVNKTPESYVRQLMILNELSFVAIVEFHWPVYPSATGYRVGHNRKVYQRLCVGTIEEWTSPLTPSVPLVIVRPLGRK